MKYIIVFIICVLILIILKRYYNLLNFNNIQREYYNNENTLSVIIPFIKRDIKYLSRCLKEQQKQTILPLEIIIAGEIPDREIRDIIISEFNDLNIIFIDSKEKTLAGVNRNLGASIAKGDIYLFTDVDDMYHPKRNEIVIYTFDKYNPLFLGHHYERNNTDFKNIKIQNIKYKLLDNIYDCTFKGINKYPHAICCSSGYIHNGHIAVSKNVFKLFGHKYSRMKRGQDSEYNSRLLRKLKNLNYNQESYMVVVEHLSFYIPNNEQL